jgi:hypothetical protein
MMPPGGFGRQDIVARRQKCANRAFLLSCRTPDNKLIGAA